MSNNLLSLIIGISMIASCCTIAYITQKIMFKKYRKQINNTMALRQKAEKKRESS